MDMRSRPISPSAFLPKKIPLHGTQSCLDAMDEIANPDSLIFQNVIYSLHRLNYSDSKYSSGRFLYLSDFLLYFILVYVVDLQV
jgi:hypothetical protein